MSERRYFHYRYIAKELGANGKKNRAKLPPCVQRKIAELSPTDATEPLPTDEDLCIVCQHFPVEVRPALGTLKA